MTWEPHFDVSRRGGTVSGQLMCFCLAWRGVLQTMKQEVMYFSASQCDEVRNSASLAMPGILATGGSSPSLRGAAIR